MYWKVGPGGKWSGTSCVLPLTKFTVLPMHATSRRKHMEVQYTRENKLLDSEFHFPLRDSWFRANTTLDGVNEALAEEPVVGPSFDLEHLYEIKDDDDTPSADDLLVPAPDPVPQDTGVDVLCLLDGSETRNVVDLNVGPRGHHRQVCRKNQQSS